MLRNTRYVLLCALAVLAASPPVLAHGVEASAASMDMSHGTHGAMNMSNTEDWPDYRNYFSHPEHTGLMYVHILLTILSWVVLMPIAVMLSIARSRFTLPAQLAFFATNATGIVASILYNQQTPDLYSGNSHHKGAWAITCIATAWFLMSLLKPYTKRSIDHEYFALSTQPASQSAMAEHDRLHDLSKFRQQRWSRDSGIASQVSSSRPSSLNSEFHRLPMHLMMEQQEDQDEQNMDEIHEPSTPEGTKFNRLLSLDFVSSLLNSLYVTLERFLIPLGFVALVTGTVAYSGIGRGNHIFNILAHLVKGSIFSGYGLLTFGRYLGAFPLFGWNWSLRPSTRVRNWTSRVPSAEFVESFVIWLYGVTNVGLERLAAADGPWTPMDVEHVGISMLFFGGGMLGMLIESFTVRRFLDRIVPGAYSNESSVAEGQDQYRHSLNPMPALTICLLGYIMSSHTQHSATSGQIHAAFGLMFTVFALARIATYITLWLKPPQSTSPTRPPTEIITSFALVCGGLIFCLSNKDTVHVLEAYELDSLFVFTFTVSLSLVVMAWEVVLLAIRNGAEGGLEKVESVA